MAVPERARPSRVESEDELLQGRDSALRGRLAAIVAAPFRSLDRRVRRRLAIAGAFLAVAALAVAVLAVADRTPPPGSAFAVDVIAATYRLPPGGGIDTTVTVSNPSAQPVTLTVVTLGRAGGRDVGLGTAVLDLGLGPGERQSVSVHGDFDCRPGRPALPVYALFTGADLTGRSRTVEAALPGSAAFSAEHSSYQERVCKLPYPLALAEIGYLGLSTTPSAADFSMTLSAALSAVPDAVPVTVTQLGTTVPGVRVRIHTGVPVTVSPGAAARLTVDWTVTDCASIPAYYGIPTIVATAVDERATETRHYALGARFGDDLARALAGACPGGRQ